MALRRWGAFAVREEHAARRLAASFYYRPLLCDYVYQLDYNGLQTLADDMGNPLDWF